MIDIFYVGTKFPLLKNISISFGLTGMKNSDFIALAKNSDKYPNLQILSLSGNNITNEGLKSFVNNNLMFISLQKISLQYNQITG